MTFHKTNALFFIKLELKQQAQCPKTIQLLSKTIKKNLRNRYGTT